MAFESIINVLANLAKILPEHEKSHIHEAFINLLSVNIINDPKLSEELILCKTVQEAYNMLAEGAPRWKVNLLEEGFVKGKEEGFAMGIKNALQEILSTRFGALSKELLTSIDKITNVNTLRSLVIEATSAESLNKFTENMRNKND